MCERIFERLFQAQDPSAAGRKGLGLGLYICKELVTREGGQIRVQSACGQGAVFSVTLPVFSLSNLLAPAFGKKGHIQSPFTLVVTEISSAGPESWTHKWTHVKPGWHPVLFRLTLRFGAGSPANYCGLVSSCALATGATSTAPSQQQ